MMGDRSFTWILFILTGGQPGALTARHPFPCLDSSFNSVLGTPIAFGCSLGAFQSGACMTRARPGMSPPAQNLEQGARHRRAADITFSASTSLPMATSYLGAALVLQHAQAWSLSSCPFWEARWSFSKLLLVCVSQSTSAAQPLPCWPPLTSCAQPPWSPSRTIQYATLSRASTRLHPLGLTCRLLCPASSQASTSNMPPD